MNNTNNNNEINTQDKYGNTCLLLVCANGYVSAAEALISKGYGDGAKGKNVINSRDITEKESKMKDTLPCEKKKYFIQNFFKVKLGSMDEKKAINLVKVSRNKNKMKAIKNYRMIETDNLKLLKADGKRLDVDIKNSVNKLLGSWNMKLDNNHDPYINIIFNFDKHDCNSKDIDCNYSWCFDEDYECILTCPDEINGCL